MSFILGTQASTFTDIGLIFVVLSAILALIARYFISKKKPYTHMIFNITAVVFLYIFLAFYTMNYLFEGVKTFGGPSDLLIPYYIFLLIHMFGAATMGILCTAQVVRSLKRFDSKQDTEWKKFPFEKEFRSSHKSLGRIGVYLWIFTAVTGVLVYLLLYVWYTPVALL